MKVEQRFSGYSNHPDLHTKINNRNKVIGSSRPARNLSYKRNALGYEVFHNIFNINPKHSVGFQGSYAFNCTPVRPNSRLLTNTIDKVVLVDDEGTALTKLTIKHFDPIMS